MRRMLESSSPEIFKLFFSRKNVMQCTVLGFNNSIYGKQPRALCIGNTHLYSHPFADGIRLLQTTICINEMTAVLNELNSRGFDSIPILCGDFNSLPDSGAYRFAVGEFIRYNDSSWEVSGTGGHKTTHVDRMAGMDLSHYLSLASAVGTPDYTHFVSKFSGCIDYIFYDKNKLKVDSYLSLPDDEVVKENVALPSVCFPSDHISLVADFSAKHDLIK
ncbi:2',5'-phosphodiesterase 12-like [Octopus sinensis]|uniref:2',5'-phosphodiesterase 12-like n=1 Tax=Octopus sinensis TaxID=2607531 RepID=A0A6P7TYZ4_9MOLL|nr:2',5'-phosphodiesterase 12-like [Octopus sinensis]